MQNNFVYLSSQSYLYKKKKDSQSNIYQFYKVRNFSTVFNLQCYQLNKKEQKYFYCASWKKEIHTFSLVKNFAKYICSPPVFNSSIFFLEAWVSSNL